MEYQWLEGEDPPKAGIYYGSTTKGRVVMNSHRSPEERAAASQSVDHLLQVLMIRHTSLYYCRTCLRAPSNFWRIPGEECI